MNWKKRGLHARTGIRVNRYGSGWTTIVWFHQEWRPFNFDHREWSLRFDPECPLICLASGPLDEQNESVRTPANWLLL